MLAVSDLLRLAREGEAAPVARSPLRYGPALAAPAVVVFNVCKHCNMRCPHCYAAASFQPSRHDLSTPEAFRVLAELAAAGVKVVIFSGGEPLLRPDLLLLARRARDLGLAPQLSSNGVLITRSKADELVGAGFQYAGVSIDGRPSFNDAYRGLEHGFARAVQGLTNARAAGLRTGVRMTVTRMNADHLDDILALAIELGADRLYLSHLLYSGRARAMQPDDLDRELGRRFLTGVFERAERLLSHELGPGIATGGNDSDGAFLVTWVLQRYGAEAAHRVQALLEQRGGNSAGEKLICIDHRGRVRPDQFWDQGVLGDLREQSLSDVLAHPLRSQLAQRQNLLGGRCADCRFLALCRGSHRERALAVHGDLWGPDPACVMTDQEVQREGGATRGLEEVAHAVS